jgi:hypothetical protein
MKQRIVEFAIIAVLALLVGVLLLYMIRTYGNVQCGPVYGGHEIVGQQCQVMK